MYNNYKIQPLEKIISILSYFSMGIVGLILLLIAFKLKKNLKFFLRYNITQSIVIAIILAIFKISIDTILSILALIPQFVGFVATVNWFLSIKVVSTSFFAYSIFEIILYTLFAYISIGILLGKNFYIPILSKAINKVVKNYE